MEVAEMSNAGSVVPEFSLVDSVIVNGLTVEASAGSGKTYSVAGAVSLLLATQPDLRISEILVTTFTRNAAAELRDRIRRQLISLEKSLRSDTISDKDALAKVLDGSNRLAHAERLDRAIREFDSATISTIHSVCSRVMAMAGLPVVGEGRTDADIKDLVQNVVNSVVISHVVQNGAKEINDVKSFSDRLVSVVSESLSSPRSLLLVNGTTDESGDASSSDFGAQTRLMVRICVKRVIDVTRGDPTFNDLLLRTADVLGPDGDAAVADAFRTRFKIAIIDEAQDTDQLQWEIFRAAFAANESERKLVTVGDPKQAIYRFRGADVEAYLSNRDEAKVQTLTRNWRSDARLIKALNAVFDGETFGEGISYLTVSAREGAPESSIGKFPSLSIVDIGEQSKAPSVTYPAAVRVLDLLQHMKIHDDEKSRNLHPQDICVLVTSRANGSKIEGALRRLGVPAVSSGTESVMASVMASNLRRLLRAMAAPGDESALRLAAATIFLGAQLVDVGSISDEDLETHGQRVFEWAAVLRRKGINALAHELRRDVDVLGRLVAGREGERRETDFAHVIELLHAESRGRGCTAEAILEDFDRLVDVDATAETVSRRVESDRDAVQIMTVHASKGLEFPVVVVADLWKVEGRGGKQSAPVFHAAGTDGSAIRHRTIDVGWVLKKEDSTGKSVRKNEEVGEKKRLFYVAMTRAKHHVSLIYAHGKGERLTDPVLERVAEVVDGECVEALSYERLPQLPAYTDVEDYGTDLRTANLNRVIDATYRRLSFSGLTKNHRGQSRSPVADIESTGGGSGDDDDIITIRSGYSDVSIDKGVPSIPMGRVPGGTYFGTVMHKVYELVDFAVEDIRSEVERVVDDVVVGSLAKHRDEIIDGVVLSLETPLGGLLDSIRLRDFSRQDRLDELGFEMGLAGFDAKVSISEIGTVVKNALMSSGRQDDILMNYLSGLEQSFTTQLVGLMNGSLDALLRVRIGDEQKFFVTDYKTNRLDRDGVDSMIAGYSRESMLEEMEHHDYPLQALIYGVGVYRFLRWARPDIDADAAVAGFSYFFVRGMVGEVTPVVDEHRHGVFSWEAPGGLWPALSDLFSRAKVAS
jgi:exodeoxyribonuclease V beta subunit